MKKQITQLMATAVLLTISSHSLIAQWSLTGNAGTTPATNFIGTTDLNSFNIRTNNQNRITVAADGKVGIGTTAPAFALDVQSTGSANLNFKSTTGTANLLLDRANSAATSSVSYRTNGVGTWQTGTVGSDNFAIRNLSLGSPAITVLNTNNNVGMGTNNPTALLHLQRSTLANALIKSTGADAQLTIERFANNNDASILYATNGVAQWKTTLGTPLLGNPEFNIYNVVNSTNAFSINGNTNNIGIGSTGAAAALQVQRNALSDVLINSTGNGAQLTIDRAGNGYESVTRYTQQGVPQWKTGLTVNANGTPDYVIRNEINNSDAVSISSSNFLTLPTGYLLLGNTNSSMINASGNDMKFTAYAPSNASANAPGNILLGATGNSFKSGNVAIGNADVSLSKLAVQGSVGNTVALFKRTDTGAGVSIIGDAPGVYFNMYYNGGQKSMTSGYGSQIYLDKSTGTMGFGVTTTSAAGAGNTLVSSNALLINSLGNVGINYFNGPSVLDVQLKAGTSATASFWGSNSGFASHFCYGANEDTYIRGGQTYSNVIIADLTNNVGIGTANPAYKLDVCGTMRAKEVRVATGWCDYVFADEYKLPALSDVEAFIKTNKHLPDVTPGSVIEGEGLEVGKTSAQMIKKIEELTLYVIDLQKQVNELKKNNK